MAWKPKAKPLSKEEAIALAKKELTPFWFGSEPLFAAVKAGENATVHPLSAEVSEKPWLMFFIDPTDYSGEIALSFAKEWHRRYHGQNLGFILIFRLMYGHLKTTASISSFIKTQQIGFPLVLDSDGMLSMAFHADQLPKVLLLSKSEVIFEKKGKDWLTEVEEEVQKFLRKNDPGLPLSPLMIIPNQLARDKGRIEFGRGQGLTFPAPGFSVGPNGLGSAHFKERTERASVKKMKAGQFFIFGKWLQDLERIATSDPNAEISFYSEGKRVGIVAESLSPNFGAAKLIVEVNGIPAYDAFLGENMAFDDDGQSLVKVEAGRMYQALADLPTENREITLKFPAADRIPVAIYGVRFGD